MEKSVDDVPTLENIRKRATFVTRNLRVLVCYLLLAIALLFSWKPFLFRDTFSTSLSIRDHTPSFDHLKSYCAHVQPISHAEFSQRQDNLARSLHQLNASAYVAEPGPNTQYYANISGNDWHLSERPLLLIISPEIVDGTIKAKVSVLTPSFEASRAKLLSISSSNVSFAEWPEDSNPYEVAISSFPSLETASSTIYVDNGIRKFIADGLAKAAANSDVESAPLEIRRLREQKSQAEIDLLRCANEVTLQAIRAVRGQMHLGMRESQGQELIGRALTASGLKNAGGLVLFGENAALPHGSGTDRILEETDFVLIDCGGTLHGYWSDITRTFALPASTIPSRNLEIWYLVSQSQYAAMRAARNGTSTGEVDRYSRRIIDNWGYGPKFTHRLGHGIGLEGHESPYLVGGSDDILAVGHTFSNEPGIYIEGEVGVRLEDIFYIAGDGQPMFLTDAVGGPAKSPWVP